VNVWSSIVPRPLPHNDKTVTTSSKQLEGLVEKNLVYGSISVNDKVLMANGLFLSSNLVVLPHHYFEAPVLDVTFRKPSPIVREGNSMSN